MLRLCVIIQCRCLLYKPHMGTSHSECCNALTVEIWKWCAEHDIWLTAAHIPGTANVQESRVVLYIQGKNGNLTRKCYNVH